jgi:hypothetical protein
MPRESADGPDGDEANEDVEGVDALAVTSNYKVLGEFDSEGGSAVLGQNNAATGTSVGVKGTVPNDDSGYGLATPDDLKVGRAVETDGNFRVFTESFAGRSRAVDIEPDTGNGEAGNVVHGHDSNRTNALGATIGGGGFDDGSTSEPNVAEGIFPTVSGGRNNTIGDDVGNDYATIGGGRDNTAQSGAEYAVIGGGQGNEVVGPSEKSTIAGGADNDVLAGFVSIGGGDQNVAETKYAVVAGGIQNEVRSLGGNIGGGNRNLIDTGLYATIAGGAPSDFNDETGTRNEAYANRVAIGGGGDNQAGAANNTRSDGQYATVPGGLSNTASGNYSFAAGRRAKATDDGSFVWADSTDTDVTSSESDRFLVSAANGATVSADVGGALFDQESFPLLVENRDSGGDNLVLGLKTANPNDPGAGTNFVQFFSKDGSGGLDNNGAIEGDGAGGVAYQTSAADYAEFLPRVDPDEDLEPGDVVGVVGGAVTVRTEDADRVLVVAEASGVLGNAPGRDERGDYETVAFTGQVPTKVRGSADVGDLVVPTGEGDGVAETIDSAEWRPGVPIVGQAWESTDDGRVSKVTVAVGVDDPSVVGDRLAEQRERIETLETENERLRDRLAEVEERLTAVEPGPADSPAPADD